MKPVNLEKIAVTKLITLRRNPQYLTPKQMDSLKKSIERDGFCVPVLVRPNNKKFEIISGNHRYMAAMELGLTEIPCVVATLSDRDAKRLAINLNTIHGSPNAELLAPFLAELDLEVLREIHLEKDLKEELEKFDENLVITLGRLEVPDAYNQSSHETKNEVCICEKCGRKHLRLQV